ncbi:MAG: hypothetical protein ACLRSW_13310 [Christensenellaceae bacterium]
MRKKTRCFTDGAENAREGGVPPCGAASVTQKEIPGKAKKNGFALWGFILSLLQVVPALTSISRSLCRSSPGGALSIGQYTGTVCRGFVSVLGIVLFSSLPRNLFIRLRMQGFLSWELRLLSNCGKSCTIRR